MSKCQRCRGLGYIRSDRVPKETVMCVSCNGEGFVGLNPEIYCKNCNGTGKVEIQGELTCPDCKGEGGYWELLAKYVKDFMKDTKKDD